MAVDLDAHLSLIQSGDLAAFGRWVSGAEPAMRGSLRAFAPHVDTEAVLQEGLLRVWQVAPRFRADGRPNSLLRFAFRVTAHLALSEARRLRPSLADDATLQRAAEAAEGWTQAVTPDPLLRQLITLCREKLPGAPAKALTARLAGAGQTDEALAQALSMKLNTFLQNFTRARKLLAECLRKRGVDLSEVL